MYFFFFFFFLMIRRPPRSTLFPYRRSSDLAIHDASLDRGYGDAVRRLGLRFARSEEHTSELQSQSNLVCRLLLEKKKIKNKILIYNKTVILNTHTPKHEVEQRRIQHTYMLT